MNGTATRVTLGCTYKSFIAPEGRDIGRTDSKRRNEVPEARHLGVGLFFRKAREQDREQNECEEQCEREGIERV
jgi:hypothetical protein